MDEEEIRSNEKGTTIVDAEVQMNESCRVESVRDGSVAVVRTDGYINREGGEEIERCIQLCWTAASRRSSSTSKRRRSSTPSDLILIEVLEK